jgi:hypothetical protein
MMRFLGVLVGSTLAVAALVVFVGIPEFTTESSIEEDSVITLPMRANAPAPEPEPEAEPQEAPAVAGIDAPAEPPAPRETVTEEPEAAPAPAESPPMQVVAAPQWYAFWSPFRSEIAANGFVDQLQRVTGLDYRVVKVKPGVYEVAFAYEDDGEITANLSQISAATGLQLPEG